jgi:hypothetical protein
VLVFLSAFPAAAQYALKARRDHAVGNNPVGVIVADFDADGNTDLISVDQGSNALTLVKGFGDGSFRTLGSVAPGIKPSGAAYVDVNHDGFADLVASNFLTSDVTVNLGNGFGAFAAKISTPMAATAFGLTVGDWNNDTHPDVATVNTTANIISVLRGNGTGTFANLTQYAVGTAPSFILNADFNADTFVDLVVANAGSDSVQVWRNNGAGAFALNTTLSTGAGTYPLAVAAADLNADGRPDLAVCLRDSDEVKVYLANATGGFLAPTTLSPGLGPRSVTVADLNKDGKPDLIIGMALISGVGEIAVMSGNGSGGFAAPVIASTGPRPDALAVGDFNRDGNLDVVAASLVGNTLCVLETTANGAFIVADRIQLPVNSTPTNVVVADFDLDGNPDIAATSEATDEVSIVRGNGLGGFLAPQTQPTGNTSGPWALAVIDVNGDTAPDLAVVNDGTNSMSVLTNNGSGAFTSSNGQSIGLCENPVAIAAGEIDGNLHTDIAYVCDVSYHLCTRRGTGLGGSNAFGPPACALYDGLPDLEGVALGQFNLDALMDPAFTSNTSVPPAVAIGVSDGFGGLAEIPAAFPTGAGPRGVVRGDLNNDGYDDLVVANAGSTTISALIGDGGGAFSYPSIESAVGRNPSSVTLADFNLDGFLDAAAVNTNANNVSFLLGDGFGNFTKVGDFGARDLPLSIAAGDFNLDGKPDLVVGDYWTETLTVLLNQSSLFDPMQTATILGFDRAVFRWGIVPGAVYDVIRGSVNAMTAVAGAIDLGPVTCLADDLTVTDTGNFPDTANPAVGEGFFYLVRTVVGGVAGPYTVATDGRPGTPSSGGCY